MKTSKIKILTFILLVTSLIAAFVFIFVKDDPKKVIFHVLEIIGQEIPPESDEIFPKGFQKYDDYFAVKKIDEQTYAILEYQYWQKNVIYLLLGDEKAIQFDTGTGYGDLDNLVKKLTDLPIEVFVSHYHYDHIGNISNYTNLNLVDDESVDRSVRSLRGYRHYGKSESKNIKEFYVKKVYKDGDKIDLGNRIIEIVKIPGHTPESIALYDKERNSMFIGDFTNEGPMIFFLIGSSVKDSLHSTEKILTFTDEHIKFYPAHFLGSNLYLESEHLKSLYRTFNKLIYDCGYWCRNFQWVHRVNDTTYITYPFLWTE